MTRSGLIVPENKVEDIDRGAEECALWERRGSSAFSPPPGWIDLTSPEGADVASVVRDAQVVAMAVGGAEAAHRLLDDVLKSVGSRRRVYLYGGRALERDAAFVRKLAANSDRVLARFGAPPPADWITVGAGTEGLLFTGPPTGRRRWAIPVRAEVSRSLFVAFHTLFWFRAEREALPDFDGAWAIRKPLDSPFRDPGTDVQLAAGRLRFGQALDDPVSDAEIRVSHSISGASSARLFFMHPGDGAVSLKRPLALRESGSQVVWVGTGLPETAITRSRMVMSLAEAPIALQLEWPARDAIAMLNRLDDAARQPEWEFRAAARLDSIANEVMLEGATEPARVAATVELDGGDVPASLLEFDHARPEPFPDIPPLALKVKMKWRRIPARVPPDAGRAKIQNDWDRVDDWARRVADEIRDALEECKDGDDKLEEHARIEDELVNASESPPSRVPAEAGKILVELADLAGDVNRTRQSIVSRKQEAEDEAELAGQKAEWKIRIELAKANTDTFQKQLADLEAPSVGPDRPDRATRKRMRREIATLNKKIKDERRAASEEFRFRKPERLPPPPPIDAQPPTVPQEGLPEIGALYERNGRRFLAIRNWGQVGPATPVADRLRAELVADRTDAAKSSSQ